MMVYKIKLNKLRVNDCFVYNETISNNSIRKHKKHCFDTSVVILLINLAYEIIISNVYEYGNFNTYLWFKF